MKPMRTNKGLLRTFIHAGYKGVALRSFTHVRDIGNKIQCVLNPTTVRSCGPNREIVTSTLEKTTEFKGEIKKSWGCVMDKFHERHVLQAGLPVATGGVFHVHPPLSYGAAEEDLRKHVLPFIMECWCHAIAGGGNKSEFGLFNIAAQAMQGTWNDFEVMSKRPALIQHVPHQERVGL